MTAIFIYVTCASREEAGKIADALVESGLAACVNIMGAQESVYRWQGKIEKASETGILIKTRDDLFEAVKDKVLALHSYDCPCIAAWPVTKGHAPYLEWINAETR
ncbi:MAG TPA: divalent-cation tolerance protein CutA [Rhodospirillaceae bacterium]|nr:divalent-cation tolerance protein CutA [Rhodospirillaceae bacterium]